MRGMFAHKLKSYCGFCCHSLEKNPLRDRKESSIGIDEYSASFQDDKRSELDFFSEKRIFFVLDVIV